MAKSLRRRRRISIASRAWARLSPGSSPIRSGRTGDLVGAINAVGPSLENIAKMRDQFGLTGEQLGAGHDAKC